MSNTAPRILAALALASTAGWSYAEEISHSAFGNVDRYVIRELAINLKLIPHTS